MAMTHRFRWKYGITRLIGIALVLCAFFGFENVAMAQDMADSAIELSEEMRDMPVSSTIRLLFILWGLSYSLFWVKLTYLQIVFRLSSAQRHCTARPHHASNLLRHLSDGINLR